MNCKGSEIFSFLRSISLEIDAVRGKSRNEGLDGVIVSSLLRRAMPCKLWSSYTTPCGMWSGARRLGEKTRWCYWQRYKKTRVEQPTHAASAEPSSLERYALQEGGKRS